MDQIWWMLGLIPDDVLVLIYHGLIAAGLFLYIGSKLFKRFPFKYVPILGQYPLISEILGIVSLSVGLFMYGGFYTTAKWREQMHQLELQIQQMEHLSDDLNKKIEEERKKKQKVRVEYYNTVKTQIKEVEKIIDGKCELDPKVNEIHNKAAKNPEIKK